LTLVLVDRSIAGNLREDFIKTPGVISQAEMGWLGVKIRCANELQIRWRTEV